jgi:hypothetical protein
MSKQKHTYNDGYQAHLGIGKNLLCIIPDQVADNQDDYDGKTFIAIVPAGYRGTGTTRSRKMRVRLVGDDYGLGESCTGDVVVRPVRWAEAF